MLRGEDEPGAESLPAISIVLWTLFLYVNAGPIAAGAAEAVGERFVTNRGNDD